jgi:hypothetical protein
VAAHRSAVSTTSLAITPRSLTGKSVQVRRCGDALRKICDRWTKSAQDRRSTHVRPWSLRDRRPGHPSHRTLCGTG